MLDRVRPAVLRSHLELEHPDRVPVHLPPGVDVALHPSLARGAHAKDAVELGGLILDRAPDGHER